MRIDPTGFGSEHYALDKLRSLVESFTGPLPSAPYLQRTPDPDDPMMQRDPSAKHGGRLIASR